VCRFPVRGSDGLVDERAGILGSTMSVHSNDREVLCGTLKVLLQRCLVIAGYYHGLHGEIFGACLTIRGGLMIPNTRAERP
jgi:hypothetical protein